MVPCLCTLYCTHRLYNELNMRSMQTTKAWRLEMCYPLLAGEEIAVPEAISPIFTHLKFPVLVSAKMWSIDTSVKRSAPPKSPLTARQDDLFCGSLPLTVDNRWAVTFQLTPDPNIQILSSGLREGRNTPTQWMVSIIENLENKCKIFGKHLTSPFFYSSQNSVCTFWLFHTTVVMWSRSHWPKARVGWDGWVLRIDGAETVRRWQWTRPEVPVTWRCETAEHSEQIIMGFTSDPSRHTMNAGQLFHLSS